MKKHIIKNTRKYLILGLLCIIATACKKDIFDKGDLNGIDPNIWNVETATNLYINKTYDLIMPNWPVAGALHNTTDETNGANTTLLYGQLTDNSVTDIATNNDKAANDQYYNIRRLNLAITGIEGGTLAPEIKAKLKGQMYFFRAYMYFNLVKLYGGVPLVLKSQDLANDSLGVPRAKTSVCIKQIAADLDSCYGLPATWPLSTDGGRITRSVALALKGKVLMYWASPQFNPNDDLQRWEDAYQACKIAYNQALADGYDLISNFSNIFIDETSANKERMMWRTYDNITINPGRGTNTENIVRPVSETTGGGGSYQPTWNLVQAFPMKNGLPITDALAGYDATLFWVNRDPRFDATIAFNGSVWPLSAKTGRKQWNYVNVGEDASKQSATGFYCRKISNASVSAAAALYNSNSGGGSGMDWIEMRFAEVLLNLAETANGSNRLGEAQTLLIKLRTRAGISATPYNYGISKLTSRPLMAAALLTEREVEFAMEGKRYDDLRRTRQFHLLTGTQRLGYKWTIKSPYSVATLESLTLGFKPRDTININNPVSYNKFFTPSTFSIESGASTIIFPTTYYFYPLPTNFRTSSVLIQQTVGWPAGTFDPLQ